jgi:Peroxidase
MTKGAHIIGYAMCTFFRSRIYNDTNIDTCFAQSTQSNCPTTSGLDYDNVAPLDLQTSNTFNNYYYKNRTATDQPTHRSRATAQTRFNLGPIL